MIKTRFKELLARKERLEGRTITRRDVADETGVSLTSIQNYALNKVTRFDAEVLIGLCRYFGCPLSGEDGLLLLEEDEPAQNAQVA